MEGLKVLSTPSGNQTTNITVKLRNLTEDLPVKMRIYEFLLKLI